VSAKQKWGVPMAIVVRSFFIGIALLFAAVTAEADPVYVKHTSNLNFTSPAPIDYIYSQYA
jgi:RsiW-degrading membrane proteinase PrsW (M82 family)